MCGIPAFDLKGFMLVLGNIIRLCQLRYNIIMVSKIIPAFDLKGFMLVLGNTSVMQGLFGASLS